MFDFANPERAIFFLLPLFLLILFLWKNASLDKRAAKVFQPKMQSVLLQREHSLLKAFRSLLLMAVLSLLILAAMRPQGELIEETVQKKGRDLVFVLDVSKSMLAKDLSPNRLERSKQMILDLVNELKGDRVALILFAGSVRLKSPLTVDYNYFKNILKTVQTSDIQKGGTELGTAIQIASGRLFYDQNSEFKEMILITDGEDLSSTAVKAAEEAKAKQIRIHTIGIGDPKGSYIPNGKGGFLKFRGKKVVTKLDEKTLQQISNLTGGLYIPVQTRLADLGELYHQAILKAPRLEGEKEQGMLREERFALYLYPALFLLLLESLLPLLFKNWRRID